MFIYFFRFPYNTQQGIKGDNPAECQAWNIKPLPTIKVSLVQMKIR